MQDIFHLEKYAILANNTSGMHSELIMYLFVFLFHSVFSV